MIGTINLAICIITVLEGEYVGFAYKRFVIHLQKAEYLLSRIEAAAKHTIASRKKRLLLKKKKNFEPKLWETNSKFNCIKKYEMRNIIKCILALALEKKDTDKVLLL